MIDLAPSVLDWLYVPRCPACEVPASSLCTACRASLTELGPACPRCAEPTGEHAVVCRRCRTAPLPLARISTPWRFGGQLEIAIKRLKFAQRTHVARELVPVWADVLAAAVHEHAAIVVPVPLHWRRRWKRGFDHTWLLALHACRAAELPPPVPALRRIRATPPQSQLTAAARRENLRGAFVARADVAGRHVVLVDDVVTTGATVAAAAQALLAGGAREVEAVAIARATSA